MSKRRKPDMTSQLFPFLDVLMSALGAMFLLLLCVTRQEQLSRHKEIQEYQQKTSETTQPFKPPPLPPLARRIELEPLPPLPAEVVEPVVGRTLPPLVDHPDPRPAALANFEQAKRRLQDLRRNQPEPKEPLDRMDELATQLQRLRAQLDELVVANRDLSETERERRRQLEKLQIERGRFDRRSDHVENRYAIIPYTGANGTTRRPIYLEIRQSGFILQPEGVEFTPDLFAGPNDRSNPLADVVQAIISETRSRQTDGEPYPLMVVRQDGVAMYYNAQKALAHLRVQTGYELVEDDVALTFGAPNPRVKEIAETIIAAYRRRNEALAARNRFDAMGGDAYGGAGGGDGRRVGGRGGSGSGSAGSGSGEGLHSEFDGPQGVGADSSEKAAPGYGGSRGPLGVSPRAFANRFGGAPTRPGVSDASGGDGTGAGGPIGKDNGEERGQGGGSGRGGDGSLVRLGQPSVGGGAPGSGAPAVGGSGVGGNGRGSGEGAGTGASALENAGLADGRGGFGANGKPGPGGVGAEPGGGPGPGGDGSSLGQAGIGPGGTAVAGPGGASGGSPNGLPGSVGAPGDGSSSGTGGSSQNGSLGGSAGLGATDAAASGGGAGASNSAGGVASQAGADQGTSAGISGESGGAGAAGESSGTAAGGGGAGAAGSASGGTNAAGGAPPGVMIGGMPMIPLGNPPGGGQPGAEPQKRQRSRLPDELPIGGARPSSRDDVDSDQDVFDPGGSGFGGDGLSSTLEVTKRPLRRDVVVECRSDGLILHPSGIFVAIDDDVESRQAAYAVYRHAAEEMQQWGSPGGVYRWQPYVVFLVRPDGYANYYRLRFELIGSGLRVDRKLVDDDLMLEFPRWEPSPNPPVQAGWRN